MSWAVSEFGTLCGWRGWVVATVAVVAAAVVVVVVCACEVWARAAPPMARAKHRLLVVRVADHPHRVRLRVRPLLYLAAHRVDEHDLVLAVGGHHPPTVVVEVHGIDRRRIERGVHTRVEHGGHAHLARSEHVVLRRRAFIAALRCLDLHGAHGQTGSVARARSQEVYTANHRGMYCQAPAMDNGQRVVQLAGTMILVLELVVTGGSPSRGHLQCFKRYKKVLQQQKISRPYF